MEKYGVTCACPKTKPSLEQLEKTASGLRCPECGHVYPVQERGQNDAGPREGSRMK